MKQRFVCLTEAELGDNNTLQAGENVVLIGNYPEFMQFDEVHRTPEFSYPAVPEYVHREQDVSIVPLLRLP